MTRAEPGQEGFQTIVDPAGFICRESDALWLGVERCLDNGLGVVFITDESGALTGSATMEAMRKAIHQGVLLTGASMAEVAAPWVLGAEPRAATPVLDAKGCVTGIAVRAGHGFLPVAEPDLTHVELRNVLDAFLSTWISSQGDYLRTFEQRFAGVTGMAHGIATSNGTVSLQLALEALGIGEGDEVIVPDFTFAASANAVIHAGARPVLVDVSPETWCIAPEAIERAITPRTRAVMPVHVFGRPAPMTEIMTLARARGLTVIEDGAEAHGARYDGRPVGSFGDIASFSFFANKILTTGEGGICLTGDPALADRMRVLRDHGMRPERRYWHEVAGFNFRMTNLQAAIGLAQLERMGDLLAMRSAVDVEYRSLLSDTDGIAFPPAMTERSEPVVWFSCITAPAEKRARLIDACRQAGIDLRPFFNSLSAMPAYRDCAAPCPVSATLAATGLNLPTSRKVTPAVARRIASVIRAALA